MGEGRRTARLLLRIEDIDAAPPAARTTRQAIYEDLAWLGIAWEQTGPPARASISMTTRAAAREARGAGAGLSELREPLARSRRLVAEARNDTPPVLATALGRAIPTGRRSIPVNAASALREGERRRLIDAGKPYAPAASTWPPRFTAGSEPLIWTESGAGSGGKETGTVPGATAASGGDVVLGGARTCRRAITSRFALDDACQSVDRRRCAARNLFWATSVHRLIQALLGLPSHRDTITTA